MFYLIIRDAEGERQVELPSGELTMGRSAENPVRLHGADVTRRHARLKVSAAAVEAQDCGSRYGTSIRRSGSAGPPEPLSPSSWTRVHLGDTILFGSTSAATLRASAGTARSTPRVSARSSPDRVITLVPSDPSRALPLTLARLLCEMAGVEPARTMDERLRSLEACVEGCRGLALVRRDGGEPVVAAASGQALAVLSSRAVIDRVLGALDGDPSGRTLIDEAGTTAVACAAGQDAFIACFDAAQPASDAPLLQIIAETGRALAALAHAREAAPLQPTAPLPTASAAHAGRPATPPFAGVASSRVLRQVLERLEQAALRDEPVLLLGESGVGKELLAEHVHDVACSAGRKGRFVAVNLADRSEGVVESELFGHVKGSFTGADRTRLGVIAEASGGTLFLDEIGDLSPDLQLKLFRFLSTGTYRAVGSEKEQRSSARIVAATNKPLRRMVEQGRFREELFWRLNVHVFTIPPLRERREDILPLARTFLARLAPDKLLDLETVEWLLAHPWPNNVRQLENYMKRAAASPDRFVRVEHVVRAEDEAEEAAWSPLPLERKQAEHEFWKEYLVRLHAAAEGRLKRAAKIAGMDPKRLRRRLRDHGLMPRAARPRQDVTDPPRT